MASKRAQNFSNGSGGKRVPDEMAISVCRHLRQTGELDVLLGLLQDDADAQQRTLGALLGKLVIHDPVQLAEFNKLQGALDRTHKFIRSFATLGRAPTKPA